MAGSNSSDASEGRELRDQSDNSPRQVGDDDELTTAQPTTIPIFIFGATRNLPSNPPPAAPESTVPVTAAPPGTVSDESTQHKRLAVEIVDDKSADIHESEAPKTEPSQGSSDQRDPPSMSHAVELSLFNYVRRDPQPSSYAMHGGTSSRWENNPFHAPVIAPVPTRRPFFLNPQHTQNLHGMPGSAPPYLASVRRNPSLPLQIRERRSPSPPRMYSGRSMGPSPPVRIGEGVSSFVPVPRLTNRSHPSIEEDSPRLQRQRQMYREMPRNITRTPDIHLVAEQLQEKANIPNLWARPETSRPQFTGPPIIIRRGPSQFHFNSAPPPATAPKGRREERQKKCEGETSNPQPAAANDSTPNVCVLCNKSFRSKKALFGHMRCHPDRTWRGTFPPPVSDDATDNVPTANP